MACGATTYPHLRKLFLTKVIFDKRGIVEDFILRHKSTLKHLEVRNCPIHYNELYDSHRATSRLCSDIWDRFAGELDELRSFVTSETVHRYAFAYFHYWEDPSFGLRIHGGEELDWEEDGIRMCKDNEALERFCSAVKTRREI
ncbi:hypothetical protein C8J56DRAFT_976875 [Mycena floridula]|nr:hypothetical protein C8J56DRAFT_976875 [Mycena floridula]